VADIKRRGVIFPVSRPFTPWWPNIEELESEEGITLLEADRIIRAGRYSMVQKAKIYKRYVNTVPPGERHAQYHCTMFLAWNKQCYEDEMTILDDRLRELEWEYYRSRQQRAP
jgi:hypothetical protein